MAQDYVGRAILAAVSVNLAGVLPLFLTGAMAVQIGRDLQFGPAGIGLLSAAYAGSALVGSAPLGRRVGRIGVRRSLRLAAIIAALALLGASVAPTTELLALALAAGGLANALGQPAGNATVAQHVPESRFGLGFAVKQSGIPLATLLAGLAVPSVALTVGWRVAYVMAALLALATWLLPPPDAAIVRRRQEGRIPPPLVAPLWTLAAALVLAVIAAPSIGAFGAIAGVSIGLSEASAGLVVATGGLLGLSVRVAGGLWADRRPGGSLNRVAVLMLIGALGWSLMAVAFTTSTAGLYVGGLLIANAFGWGWPGLLHLSVARMFPTSTAAASGVTQTGVSAGLLAGPLLLGMVIAGVGWVWAWALAALAAAAAAVGVWAARRFALRRRTRLPQADRGLG